jgi:HPt (histidine-containing phosphotransfer) domain-containing protein
MTTSIELDVPGALKRVGGDRELLAQIIDFVVEDSPQFISRIETALKANQYAEVERAAHSLKGLVSNLHCVAVQDKATEIEGLARIHNRDAIAAALEVLGDLTQKMMLKIDEARRALATQ